MVCRAGDSACPGPTARYLLRFRATPDTRPIPPINIIANDEGDTTGWRTVGYEARGPSGGPIVVALVKSKDRHEDPIFRWAKDLVRKNVEP